MTAPKELADMISGCKGPIKSEWLLEAAALLRKLEPRNKLRAYGNGEVIEMMREYMLRHCNNSMREFARQTGVSPTFVSNILSGKTPVPPRYANLFGLKKTVVFLEDEQDDIFTIEGDA